MTEAVLALNAGSSSLKFGLFERPTGGCDPLTLAVGSLQARGSEAPQFRVTSAGGAIMADEYWTGGDQHGSVMRLVEWVETHFGHTRLAAVGHRVVHGGATFSDPVVIDDANLAGLDALTPLAPLHQPRSLAPVRQIRASRPRLPQVACFDTAFHHNIQPPASRYALPRSLEAEGVRRYGFHGLSYESIAAQLKAERDQVAMEPGSRIIVAHLGNGASLCAMRGLNSVDTTMGFSTLDGLVMGTRPGSVDPGILLYLLQEKSFSVARLEQLLYHESGLLGVSGISPDVAVLLASDVPAAAEALDIFAFQVARQTAALVATLGGLDRFIFTGGIGENSPAVRRMIADRIEWMGAELDEGANQSGVTGISTATSSISLERRSTQEELMIARHVFS